MPRSMEADTPLKAEPVRDRRDVAAVRTVLSPRRVQPGLRTSFSTADRDGNAGRLDFVAGGEFLDDRIRLAEWLDSFPVVATLSAYRHHHLTIGRGVNGCFKNRSIVS